MNAGILRDFITIEKCKISRTSTGGQIEIWSLFWSGRANVSMTRGNLLEQNGEMINSLTKKVKMRQVDGIEPTMRLEIKKRHYAILSIDENSLDRSITLNCELIIE